MIESCKKQGTGWIVNGVTYIPNNPSLPEYHKLQDWIAAGNTPEPEYTSEELSAHAEALRLSKTVSMRQARLALLASGILSQIEAAIAALPEPDKSAVTIEWEYAQEVKRSHAWVIALGTQLGLTDQQLDDLFTLAASL